MAIHCYVGTGVFELLSSVFGPGLTLNIISNTNIYENFRQKLKNVTLYLEKKNMTSNAECLTDHKETCI